MTTNMSSIDILRVLANKKGSLLLSGIFVAALAFFVVTLVSPRFKTTTDFMVVQTTSQSQDFYSLFKSSEYLGRVLAQAVGSERFINAVLETGKLSKEFLPVEKSERLNTWREIVTVESNAELGMMSVIVKADTDRETSKIMQAVSEVLMTKNAEFRGGDEKAVEIRVLSGPITERNPEPKELILIILMAFLTGVALMALRVLLKALKREY